MHRMSRHATSVDSVKSYALLPELGTMLHTAWPRLPPGIFKWNEGTLPFLWCHSKWIPWHGKNCTAMKSVNRFDFLPWTSNCMAWEVIEVKFNSFKLCGNLCIEVHLNRLMHYMRQSFACSMGAMPAKFVIDRHASRQANLKQKDMT